MEPCQRPGGVSSGGGARSVPSSSVEDDQALTIVSSRLQVTIEAGLERSLEERDLSGSQRQYQPSSASTAHPPASGRRRGMVPAARRCERLSWQTGHMPAKPARPSWAGAFQPDGGVRVGWDRTLLAGRGIHRRALRVAGLCAGWTIARSQPAVNADVDTKRFGSSAPVDGVVAWAYAPAACHRRDCMHGCELAID